jgi:hypothetical protein
MLGLEARLRDICDHNLAKTYADSGSMAVRAPGKSQKKVSGKERRRVSKINYETAKAIVRKAQNSWSR